MADAAATRTGGAGSGDAKAAACWDCHRAGKLEPPKQGKVEKPKVEKPKAEPKAEVKAEVKAGSQDCARLQRSLGRQVDLGGACAANILITWKQVPWHMRGRGCHKGRGG